jgi:hypothetical protein
MGHIENAFYQACNITFDAKTQKIKFEGVSSKYQQQQQQKQQ